MTDPRSSTGSQVSPGRFRAALGRFATGVTVVTTMIDDHPHGMTANAFTSASLQPPLLLVCVDRGALMHGFLADAASFGVSILAAGQQELSIWFAAPERPTGPGQFRGIGWTHGPATGTPLLEGAAATLECRRVDMFPAGDHSIYMGEVVTAEFDLSVPPLLYLDGAYVPSKDLGLR